MALSIGGAFAMHFGVTSALREGVYDAKVILPVSEGFLQWCCPKNPNITEAAKKVQYDSVSMFNLTNPEDVLKGKKPIYEQQPFVRYRKYLERKDITFRKDNNTVSFHDRSVYVHEPEENEKIDPQTTRITNINPAYLAIIQKAQDENLLMYALGLATIQNLFLEKLFNTEFAVYMNLLQRRNYIVQDIQAAKASAGSEQAFCVAFAKAEAPNGDDIWNKMLPAKVSNITFETCQTLFDESTGLFVKPQQVIRWMKAIAYSDAVSTEEIAGSIKTSIAKTQTILEWVTNYDLLYIFPENVKAAINQLTDAPGQIDNYKQYGLLQWTTGRAIPGSAGKSIHEIVPGSVPNPPELAIVNGQTSDFVALSTALTLSTTDFFDQDTFQLFLKLISDGDFITIQNRFGLNQDAAMNVYLYVVSIKNQVVTDFPTDYINKGLGLITTKTIHEWVMDYEDPLLEKMGEGAKSRDLLVLQNETWAEATSRRLPSSIYTGNDDINRVNEYSTWNGSEWLTLWKERVRIVGRDGDQFHSNMKLNDDAYIWFPSVLRPQNFSAVREVYHEDIRMLRLLLKPNMSLPTPIFHNNFTAIANMTILGAPMYISKWFLCQAETYLRDAIDVIGLKEDDLEIENCDTVIDVEPISGISMFERKRVQLNAYIDGKIKEGLSLFQPLLKANVMYPIARILESSEISPDQASAFRSQVTTLVTVQTVLYWVLIAIGLVFFVVGGATLIVGCAISSRVKKQKLAQNQ
eukprot:CAMPEP_0117430436 /NCGR_PEP_ID=MMETSP0758-20121206/9976_1 /TAXON_ID=63605 /ORGANISM="Percolomonas cosmopolitus, Strain AE-1 (ATCC 50343)" /LENGTH=746 /DNA_ID=CAMNT_0005218455 /DNA_START=305 /DNA_END=2545 /DNA_ORIENTATION=+